MYNRVFSNTYLGYLYSLNFDKRSNGIIQKIEEIDNKSKKNYSL